MRWLASAALAALVYMSPSHADVRAHIQQYKWQYCFLAFSPTHAEVVAGPKRVQALNAIDLLHAHNTLFALHGQDRFLCHRLLGI